MRSVWRTLRCCSLRVASVQFCAGLCLERAGRERERERERGEQKRGRERERAQERERERERQRAGGR